MARTRLGEIAYARSGDKGAGSNIGLIAYTAAGYDFLRNHVLADIVENFFADLNPGRVIRYELPNLGALNFILPTILDGGGSVSLRIDAQGKALGQALLEMVIDVPDDVLPAILPSTESFKLGILEVDRTDPAVSVITLNRPEKRNALNLDLIRQFTISVVLAAAGPGRRALIFRGNGPSFCAGMDLAEASSPENAASFAQALLLMYTAIADSPLVTIAAPHGVAMGGGAGLLAACDFVVAADDLRLAYPEVRRGLVAALVTCILRRKLSDQVVRELILRGEEISARRALELGLISQVVPASETLQAAKSLAATVSLGAPGAIKRTKELLGALSPRSLEEDLQLALGYHVNASNSDEAAEGMAAFREKRPPKWDARSALEQQ